MPGQHKRRHEPRGDTGLNRRLPLILAASLSLVLLLGCSATPRRTAAPAQGQQPVAETAPAPPAALSGIGAGLGGPLLPRLAATRPPDLGPLQAQIAAYVAGLDGTWGVAVIDLPSGRWVGVNENIVFRTASTYKVPLVMYALDQVARGQARLDEQIRYDADDFEEGTGILQGTDEGTPFRLERLMQLSITHSDNIAANMLIRRFGRRNVWAWQKELGVQVTHDTQNHWVATPLEMARTLAALESGRALPPPQRRLMLGWLQETLFLGRLRAGIPADVPVAHKIGNLAGIVNDVGIIYAPGRPFAMAVYSREVRSGSRAADAIAELARMVYNYEVQLAQEAGGETP